MRWEPDSRGRLERAALDLYGEGGFENTTVAEIAERAGVTERTFFRHFADKREVLFPQSGEARELLVSTVAGAADAVDPVEAVVQGFEAIAAVIQERGEFALRRQAIIAANPELQERELVKLAEWSSAVAQALREHGVAEPEASLAAQVGMAVFRTAFQRWRPEADEALPQLVRDSLEQLRAVTAGS